MRITSSRRSKRRDAVPSPVAAVVELLLLDDPIRNLHDSVAQEVMENVHNLPCTTIFTTNEPAMIKHADLCAMIHNHRVSEVYDTSNMREGSRLWRLWALNQVKMKGGGKGGKPEDNKVDLHASFLSTSCGGKCLY